MRLLSAVRLSCFPAYRNTRMSGCGYSLLSGPWALGLSVCWAKIYAVFAVSPLEGFGVSNLRFDGTKSNYWRFGKFAYICGAELC